jgi:hypothetical protein
MRSTPIRQSVRRATPSAVRSAVRAAALAAASLWATAACAGMMASTPLPFGEPMPADVTQKDINGPVLQAAPTRSLGDVVSTYWPSLGRQAATPLPSAFGEPVGVYANGALIGGLSDLRAIRSGDVVHLQRLNQSEEYSRFGRSHPQGAVVVTWRTR